MNENTTAALGVLGAVSCVGLLGWLLFRPAARAPGGGVIRRGGFRVCARLLDVLGVFNGAAILYGTIGGVGMMFALFVSPQMRGLNRISVLHRLFLAGGGGGVPGPLVRPSGAIR